MAAFSCYPFLLKCWYAGVYLPVSLSNIVPYLLSDPLSALLYFVLGFFFFLVLWGTHLTCLQCVPFETLAL